MAFRLKFRFMNFAQAELTKTSIFTKHEVNAFLLDLLVVLGSKQN
jgi:hypothetical protein